MTRLDRKALLARLDPVGQGDDDEQLMAELEQLNMAGSLLLLANINPEQEYNVCRAVAQHLLGVVHEPEDIGLGEE